MRNGAGKLLLNLVVGMLAILACSLLWGWAFQHISFLGRIDAWGYRAAFKAPRNILLDWLSWPLNYSLPLHSLGISQSVPAFFNLLILVFAGYIWVKDRAQFGWFLLCCLMGGILVHFVSLLSAHLEYRIRPFITLNEVVGSLSGAWKNLSSFPSGHARDIGLYCLLFALFVPKFRWFCALIIVFVLFSRVYQGAHYPSDVLAGAGIGMSVALLVWKTQNTFRKTKGAAS